MPTKITNYGNVAVLISSEDLVGDAAQAFSAKAEHCLSEGSLNFVVDCSTVRGVDSQGLESLLSLQDKCEESFGVVKLCCLDDTLKKILEITRLTRRFEAFDDLDSAVKSFS